MWRGLPQVAIELHDFASCQVVVKTHTLRKEADQTSSLSWVFPEIKTSNRDSTRVGQAQPDKTPQHRALAAPVGSQQSKRLTRHDLERHVAQREEIAESLGQMAYLDNRL